MKISLLALLAITLALCGCAAYHNTFPTNGTLQIYYHVPEDMVGQTITTYFNGSKAYASRDLTNTSSLFPGRNTVRVEMSGTKPFEQTVKIKGNGVVQVLDVALEKQ